VSQPEPDAVAVILVGDELLTGHTSDTNGPWLGRRLTDEGLRVVTIMTAPDDVHGVVRAIEHGLETARAVVVTGGLGPTPDDVTRAALAGLPGEWTRGDLANDVGLEPGVRLESGRGTVFAVPGVPGEMRAMVAGHVVAAIIASAGQLSPRSTRSLTVVGLGEPGVVELLAPVEEYLAGRGRLAYLPCPAEVEVRIAVTGADADDVATTAAVRARRLLGDLVAAEDKGIEETVVEMLRTQNATVATAESLTGGLVAAALVSVPGASEVMRSGVVAYASELKVALVGVAAEVLRRDGAIARTTAAAMAEGVRVRCGAGFGVATTGVAGPDPQEGHPPGTMHIAVASEGQTRVGSFEPSGKLRDRQTVRRQAVVRALDLLRRTVMDIGPGPGESAPARTR
jgi:nicotinamide-nucleotide amidase